MKKFLIIICLLLLISGCGKNKEKTTDEVSDSFVLSKIDNDKDYVYSNDISSYMLSDGSEYISKDIVINLNSNDASNANMEIRSFIRKANKDNNDTNGVLTSGCIYDYVYYVNDDYLSLVITYKYLRNGIYSDEESLVYVLSLTDGKKIDNKSLLDTFSLSEEEMFNKVEEAIESEDSLYTIKSIKDNGYYLYVKDNKLIVLFYEINDDESIKKELILS
jgi:hypothetical protein